MPLSPNLRLEPATVEDVPTLTEVWYAAFCSEEMRYLWPDTPEIHKWWDDINRNALLNKPFQRYFKVVDTQSTDSNGRPRIVAYGMWDLSSQDERGPRFPPWHEQMPAEALDPFFMKLESERRRVMGNQRHYYLDILATHPDYHRKGAGSAIVEWGCDLADRDCVAAYVDASKEGAPLYERFGFVDKSLPGAGDIASMYRAGRS